MKIFKIILLVIVLGVGYLAYSLGLIGTPKPKDLGVTYGSADFDSSVEKSQIKYQESAQTDNPILALAFSGSHPVNASFSSEELTAVANTRSWQYLPFSNLQIKLREGGVEISGNLDTSKVISYLQAVGGLSLSEASQIKTYIPVNGKPTFYLDADGSVQNGKLNLSVKSLSIGAISVPSNLISENQGRVNDFLETRATAWEGFSVSSLTISDNKLNFDGTLPDTETLAR